jgi:hypothetical protein
MTDTLKISPFQERVLSVPEQYDLALLGGRGGAKSFCLALLALRHVEQYGASSRILYVRRTHAGTADFEALCRELFGLIYGTAIRFNGQEGLFRFPNGGTLEINQIEDANSYGKFQGRSFSLLLCDEIGQFPEPSLIDKLRSNLRAAKNIPMRCILAANPGDIGHSWLLKRHAWNKPWEPYTEPASGRTFVHCPSTFLDNPFIDQEEYRKQLGASCPTDPELLKSWLEGDWTTHVRGAFFGQVLDQSRNLVERWPGIPDNWPAPYICHDFGVAAPSVTYILAVSPGATAPDGKWYARDSIIAVDELATNEPGRLDRGMGYTTPILAEHIKELCARWKPTNANMGKYQKVRPVGVADDACFARTGSGSGSISDEFRRAGVNFSPAKKGDRLTGWSFMRGMLLNAGAVDKPGLYIARHCQYFWDSVPGLPRDPRRPEDLDSRAPDHAADSLRYGLLRQRSEAQILPLSQVVHGA